jgi:hypothetical protein
VGGSDYIEKSPSKVVGVEDLVPKAGWALLASKVPHLAPHYTEIPSANNNPAGLLFEILGPTWTLILTHQGQETETVPSGEAGDHQLVSLLRASVGRKKPLNK